jgi:hypothetical protein
MGPLGIGVRGAGRGAGHGAGRGVGRSSSSSSSSGSGSGSGWRWCHLSIDQSEEAVRAPYDPPGGNSFSSISGPFAG